MCGANSCRSKARNGGYQSVGNENKPRKEVCELPDVCRFTTNVENSKPDTPTLHLSEKAEWNMASSVYASTVCNTQLIGISNTINANMVDNEPAVYSKSRTIDSHAIMLNKRWNNPIWKKGARNTRYIWKPGTMNWGTIHTWLTRGPTRTKMMQRTNEKNVKNGGLPRIWNMLPPNNKPSLVNQ